MGFFPLLDLTCPNYVKFKQAWLLFSIQTCEHRHSFVAHKAWLYPISSNAPFLPTLGLLLVSNYPPRFINLTLSNDSDQKKMKSLFLTVQMPLWKVHWPETRWIQLGPDLPSHACVLSPLQSSAESQPHTCAQRLFRLPTLLFVSWWHLKGLYQQLMTDTFG